LKQYLKKKHLLFPFLFLSFFLFSTLLVLTYTYFHKHSEPLSPNSGIPSQLPILLAEYYFLNEQDIKDYLALLACVPAYFSSIEDYETIRSQAGLFMPSYSSQKLIQQCSSIITEKEVLNHTHFLVTTFHDRLKKLEKDSLISSDAAAQYIKENERLLLKAVIPAYKKLSSTIATLSPTSKNNHGLCYLPKGRNYYEYLLAQTTGSQKDIASIKALLQRRLKEDYMSILSLQERLKQQSTDTLTFPLQDPEHMLQDLEQRIEKDFPPLPVSSLVPSYSIKTVSPNLADYVSPAFYLTPPIDHMKDNSIYLNEKNILDDLELYTTLAHEGYPGHLYQTLYFQQTQQTKYPNLLRNLLYYGGYIEGWALYVENYSYDYAKDLLQESDPKNTLYNNILLDAYRYHRDMQLCMYSILDIAIHYDGFTYEEVYSMLAEFGIVDETVARGIYEYIVEEPANYLKYYLGYLEILELKEYLQEKMGKNYNEKQFHQMILEAGPMDFHTLKELLDKKIKQSVMTAYISFKNLFNFVNTFSSTFFSSFVSFSVADRIILS